MPTKDHPASYETLVLTRRHRDFDENSNLYVQAVYWKIPTPRLFIQPLSNPHLSPIGLFI